MKLYSRTEGRTAITTKAVLAGLAGAHGKPVTETPLATRVLEVMGPDHCIATRRYFAKRSWAALKKGRKPGDWRSRDVDRSAEAMVGAAVLTRRALRRLVHQGFVKKQAGPNGQVKYRLVRGRKPR